MGDFGVAFKVATELGWKKPGQPFDPNASCFGGFPRLAYELKILMSMGVTQLVDKFCGTKLDAWFKKRAKGSKKIEMPKVGKPYTMAEVEKHNTPDDCWVVINGQVCDLSKFKAKPPRGVPIILEWAGKDASDTWNMIHAKDTVQIAAPETLIGHIA